MPSVVFPRPVAAALGLLACLLPSAAFGYCRTMSCELDEGPELGCPRDEAGCVTEGEALWWPSSCLTYAVQVDGSTRAGLDADEVAELVAQAFRQWSSVECPGGGPPGFVADFSGFVSCEQSEYVCGDNVNTVLFHDEGWPYDLRAVGMTVPAAHTLTGRILDADIALNSELFDFSEDGVDLSVTLAHEVGHFLGLAHSREPGALMADGYHLLSRGHMLSPDDIEGICEIFPPASLSCAAPPGPAYDACQTDGTPPQSCAVRTKQASGCALTAAAPAGPAPRLLWLALPLLFGVCRHRRLAGRAG